MKRVILSLFVLAAVGAAASACDRQRIIFQQQVGCYSAPLVSSYAVQQFVQPLCEQQVYAQQFVQPVYGYSAAQFVQPVYGFSSGFRSRLNINVGRPFRPIIAPRLRIRF